MSGNTREKLRYWFNRSVWMVLSTLIVIALAIGAVMMFSLFIGIGLIVLLIVVIGVIFGGLKARRYTYYEREESRRQQGRILEGEYEYEYEYEYEEDDKTTPRKASDATRRKS